MAIEWCQVCGSSVWSGQPCGKCAHDGIVAARDAEIAALKAEVERLRESEADLIQWIFDGGQRAGIEPADLSPTEVLTRMSDDLAAHKRALAAGPAALRALPWRPTRPPDELAALVEDAQADAMKEKP